jgi:hypothetical protein
MRMKLKPFPSSREKLEGFILPTRDNQIPTEGKGGVTGTLKVLKSALRWHA